MSVIIPMRGGLVLAMALTCTLAGVLAGLSGEIVQALFQNPWVLGVFAGIFVLLSLSMFGFCALQMPGAVQDRLSAVSNKQQCGALVDPCVTAPLIYIAQTGHQLTDLRRSECPNGCLTG